MQISTLDRDKFLREVFAPGKDVGSFGEREGGKTHQIVYLNCERMRNDPHCYMFTNIIFLKFKGWRYVDGNRETVRRPIWDGTEYPERVFHITTMEETFRKTAELMEKDEDCVILRAMDEATNYMLVEQSYQDVPQTELQYRGSSRKFHHCYESITPAKKSIHPRFRNFSDDDTSPGYMTTIFFKDKGRVAMMNAANGTKIDWHKVAFVQRGKYHRPEPMFIGSNEWAKPWDELRPGDVIFDHKSSATFKLGNFDFTAMMNYVEDAPYYEIAGSIKSYFEERDAQFSPESVKKRQDLDLAWEIFRMRESHIQWKDIEKIKQRPKSTLRDILERNRVAIESTGEIMDVEL